MRNFVQFYYKEPEKLEAYRCGHKGILHLRVMSAILRFAATSKRQISSCLHPKYNLQKSFCQESSIFLQRHCSPNKKIKIKNQVCHIGGIHYHYLCPRCNYQTVFMIKSQQEIDELLI